MNADKTNANFLFSIGVYLRSSAASYVLAFLTPETCSQLPKVPFSRMVGMRNRIAPNET
jgi:hypothetical protein